MVMPRGLMPMSRWLRIQPLDPLVTLVTGSGLAGRKDGLNPGALLPHTHLLEAAMGVGTPQKPLSD